MDFGFGIVFNHGLEEEGAVGLFSFLFGRSEPKTATRSSRTPLIKWREGSFPMEVVGESQYQDVLIAICGSHTRYGHDDEYEALIELEPSNRYDANAVVVKISGRRVGYLSREQAERLSVQMRQSGLAAAGCAARVRGGWRTNQHDEGQYGVRLSIPNHGWIDFGIGAEPPVSPKPISPKLPRQAASRPEPAASGPMQGHRIALMGAASDGDIAQEFAHAGARIMAGIGASTTILVIAAERPFDFGIRRSSTYNRAETLIAEGSKLKILSLSEARAAIGK